MSLASPDEIEKTPGDDVRESVAVRRHARHQPPDRAVIVVRQRELLKTAERGLTNVVADVSRDLSRLADEDVDRDRQDDHETQVGETVKAKVRSHTGGDAVDHGSGKERETGVAGCGHERLEAEQAELTRVRQTAVTGVAISRSAILLALIS